MKKLAALLAVLMVLLLTACGSMGSDAPVVEHDDAQPNAAAEATAVPEPIATPEPEKQFSHGAWDGLTFTSEYAELTLTLPDETWTISTDEELAEMMDLGMESEDTNLLEEAMLKLTNITDMMVQNSQTGANIILMYENLKLNPAAEGLTVEEYAQIIAQGLTENESVAYTVGEIKTITLGGNEYLMLSSVVEEYGLHQNYLMRYEGGMMVDLILTAFGDDGINELLAMFAE